MARGLAGTSPTTRSATPPTQPRHSSSGPRRSSIVPFTRPGSGSSQQSEEAGSYKAGTEDAVLRLGQSLSNKRRSSVSSDWEGRSVDDGGASSLRRPERRPSSQFPRVNVSPFVRQEGFLTDGVAASATSPRSSAAPTGLLSRQFSSGTLQTKPSTEDQLKARERLQKCYEKSPSALEDAQEVDPALLLRALQLSFPVFQSHAATRAFNISRAAHQGGTAPLVRCGEVARVLADLDASEACIAAALLYNSLDAGMLTEQQLREAMPAEIADTVCNVSKLAGICQVQRELVGAGAVASEALSQKFLAMLLAMQDVPAVLIVLADRLQALRAVPSEEGAREALGVFAPLANRLGVWSIKAELEDLAFKTLHPAQHRELQALCEESQRRGTIEANLDQLKGRLAERGIAGDLSGRPKNLWGVAAKMRAKGRSVDQVYDVRALRVVVDSKSDCYEALREVHRLWAPVEGRCKDYIRRPKDNGYQSLHTVVLGSDGVPMEVQIRTHKMHWIAEYGVAAHWRYKDAVPPDVLHERQVAWCRYLISFRLELADKKVRPSGTDNSPPRDPSGFAAVLSGSSLLGGAAVAVPVGSSAALCAFPEHAPDCKFAAYFARHNLVQQPPSAAAAAASSGPVYVVVADSRAAAHPEAGAKAGGPAYRIEQLPAGCTTGELARRLSVEGARAGEGPLRMLVNQVEVTSPVQALQQCDRVEVFTGGWAEGDALALGLQATGPADLEASRQLLQRIFSGSGSLLPSDAASPFPSVASAEQLLRGYPSADLRSYPSSDLHGFSYGQPVPH